MYRACGNPPRGLGQSVPATAAEQSAHSGGAGAKTREHCAAHRNEPLHGESLSSSTINTRERELHTHDAARTAQERSLRAAALPRRSGPLHIHAPCGQASLHAGPLIITAIVTATITIITIIATPSSSSPPAPIHASSSDLREAALPADALRQEAVDGRRRGVERRADVRRDRAAGRLDGLRPDLLCAAGWRQQQGGDSPQR